MSLDELFWLRGRVIRRQCLKLSQCILDVVASHRALGLQMLSVTRLLNEFIEVVFVCFITLKVLNRLLSSVPVISIIVAQRALVAPNTGLGSVGVGMCGGRSEIRCRVLQ